MLYFAYGSNLNKERLKGRCPSAQKVAEGYLKGFKLGFQNNNSGKFVANIIESPSDIVKGIIYHIDDVERKALDRCEGHPLVYKRQKVKIDIAGLGMEVECETYIMEQVYKQEQYVPFNINTDRYKGIYKKKASYIPVYIEGERVYGIPKFEYLHHILKGYEEMDIAERVEVWEVFKADEYKEFTSKILENVSTINNGGKIIFVYGSLKKGYYNHVHYLSDAGFIGEGIIKGYDMYSLGKFPAIVKGQGRVYGELYRVTEVGLDGIDMLESYCSETDSGLYVRREVEVRTVAGIIKADAYIWGEDVNALKNRCEYIEEGNWEKIKKL